MTGWRRFCAALTAVAVGSILTPGTASAERTNGGRPPRITVTDIVAPDGGTVAFYPRTEIDERGGVLLQTEVGGAYAVWQRGELEVIQTPTEPVDAVVDLSSRHRVAVGTTNLTPCEGPLDPWPYCPHPYIWDDGEMTLLPDDGQTGVARHVNDRGSIVAGTLRRYAPEERRFVHELAGWVDGQLVRGPVEADDDIIAMNNRGQALITLQVDGTWHAAIWQVGGPVTDLDLPHGPNGEVVDINERGEVVGWQGPPTSPTPGGYLWRDGELVELGLIEPIDINDRGQVLGHCFDPAVTVVNVCIWDDGEITDLGAHSSDWSPRAINNRGQVIAQKYVDENGLRTHAYLLDEGELIDLGAAVGFDGESEAIDINDRGQIVGTLRDPVADQWRHVVWTVR